MNNYSNDGKFPIYPATFNNEQRRYNEVVIAHNDLVNEVQIFKKDIQERAGGIVGKCNEDLLHKTDKNSK